MHEAPQTWDAMAKKSRFLITTADERTWPPDGPVLFLGAWCRLQGRSARWTRFEAATVPYHWDDRERLYRDSMELRGLHEELLADLSRALNTTLGTHHSVRYWRILVGPWLQHFTQMLFDRWTMIHRAVDGYEICLLYTSDAADE